MITCPQCRTIGIAVSYQYCPMCGSPLGPSPRPASASTSGAGAPFLGPLTAAQLAVPLMGLVQSFVQSGVQRRLAPVAQVLEILTGGPAGPPVPSSEPPPWYQAAFAEGQPKIDPTEVARIQAEAHARSRQSIQMLQMAAQSSHDSMKAILSNLKG